MTEEIITRRIVKKIVNVKETEDGKRQFEVQWENTWESEENLIIVASSDLIEQFLKGQSEENNNDVKDDVKKSSTGEDGDEEEQLTIDEGMEVDEEAEEDDEEEDDDEEEEEEDGEEEEPALKDLFSSPTSKKPKGKGLSSIISRLQKTQQEGLSKQSDDDTTKPTDYVAKNPLSPTAGCEAPQDMLSSNTTASQFNMVSASAMSCDVRYLSTSSTASNQSPNVEYIQRLPSGVTTVVRSLPPGTIFYEPGQLRATPGQPLSSPVGVQHFQPTPVLKCALCSEVFYDEAKFKQHAFMHEQVNLLKNDLPKMMAPGTYECKFCHAIFDDKAKLKKHYDDQHEKELVHTQPLDQLYQCNMCDLSFLHYNALAQHQQTHAQRREVFILPKQQMQGGTIITADGKLATPLILDPTKIGSDTLHEKVNAAMTESIRIKKEQHEEASSNNKTEEGASPSMTTLDFQPVNEALLSKASTGGVERKMFRCNICDELFETEDGRAKHSLVHVNRSSSLDCHICGKQFRHRTNLSTHMIVHSGIKPHQCHICLRRFTQKVNLQRHMHIHDGSRPFTCRMCQKSFTQKANLQRHILSHTEFGKEDILQALNEIPNESEVNNAINESLSEAMSVVMDRSLPSDSSQSAAVKSEFQCDICDKVFAQKVNLQKHMLTHSGARPFQCYVCGKAFRQRSSLQKHYSVHTNGSSNFICQTCNRFFVSKTNLQRHMLVHAQTGTNLCFLCDQNFTTTDNLERHFSEHVEESTPSIALPQKFFEHSTPGQTYKCATCDIVFDSPMVFSQHLQCHQRALSDAGNLLDISDVNKAYEENQSCPMQCNTCSLIFMSVAKLETHMATHVSDSKTASTPPSPTGGTVKPANAIPITVTYQTEGSAGSSMSAPMSPLDESSMKLIKTEPNDTSASPFRRPSRCPVCKDMFPSKEGMRKHYSSAHLKAENPSSTPSIVDDEEIDMESEDSVFVEDIPVVQPETPDTQSSNGIVDQPKSRITENEERLIKENEEFIKDNILGGPAEYESKGRYERGNYSCKICNRVLTYKYSLEKHMLLHTGSFPYKCQLCSKRFNHKANLDKHLVVHSGEKPYVCHICSRPFSQKSNLQRHQLTHTQNRDFVCDVCGKRFNHMASLKTHSLIHTGAKPFACYVCHKRFNQKGNLKRHIQTHKTGKRNKMRQNGSVSDSVEMDHEDMSMMSPESDTGSYEPLNGFFDDEDLPEHEPRSERVRVKKQMEDYEFYDDDEPLPTMIGESSASETTTPSASVSSYDIRDVKEEIVTVMPSDALENNDTPPQTPPVKPKKEAFHCDTCSKLFVSMASLEAHQKSAHSSIVCEVCGKQFSQKANLLKHKLIHANKKPFPCTVCNKAFRQKANLQRHELIHSKDRKTVNCPECNKSFRCAWSLKQHMKNHALGTANVEPGTPTDNFLFGCSICGKTFHDKEQLQMHFAVHQQSPSAFGCGVCNQIYPTKDELLVHMKVHDTTGVVAYDNPSAIKTN